MLGHLDMDINWEVIYGSLTTGRYRIIKAALLSNEKLCNENCQHYSLSIEFTIK